MASEQVHEVLVRRHVFDSERPFSQVLDGIFGGISQPDIGILFSKLAASTHDAAASRVAERLDTEVLELLRQVTGMPESGTA